ncbi:flavodoxin [Anoxybacillus suryakundensis]|uniref:Flavodoxin n=1 Tax=Anoxybacillus suryakundensis TaxID=1325335 RepID=A0A0K6GRG4_9BACL|nr:flavodoxin [Anoxybacillus suryakundensis]CUA81354.1 flavodoxin, short chain [Anoxybacillus suryakundensis]
MSKVIMVFTSMTGNTEEMAETIADGVREQGIELDVKEVLDTTATELEQYDGILLGAYTWGDGELPDDFLDFYDELDHVDLTGKKAAVFGSCDSSYEKYGAAVDILIEKLQERGAEVILDGLKIELTPTDEDKQLCIAFGRDFVKQL